jgi:hypothetical protein
VKPGMKLAAFALALGVAFGGGAAAGAAFGPDSSTSPAHRANTSKTDDRPGMDMTTTHAPAPAPPR